MVVLLVVLLVVVMMMLVVVMMMMMLVVVVPLLLMMIMLVVLLVVVLLVMLLVVLLVVLLLLLVVVVVRATGGGRDDAATAVKTTTMQLAFSSPRSQFPVGLPAQLHRLYTGSAATPPMLPPQRDGSTFNAAFSNEGRSSNLEEVVADIRRAHDARCHGNKPASKRAKQLVLATANT
ncbi:unnamed protein product [Lampetra fluviatilis]